MSKLTTIISVFFIGLLLSSCGSEEKPPKEILRPVKAMVAGSVSDIAGRGFPALTKASQQSDVSFRVGGPILKYNVVEGAQVKKGELIAVIDPRDYRVALDAARARYDQAKAEAERYRRLWEKGSVAKNDYDRRHSQYLQAKAALEEAQFNLKDTRLLSPYTGYYGPKLVEVGEVVKPGQPVAVISNLSVLEVVTTIPEQVAVQFRNFESYEVRFDTYPNRVFKATLKNLEKTPSPEGFRLHLILEHKNDPNDPVQAKISAGMSCNVVIKLKETEETAHELVVPITAVVEGATDKKPSVWILKPLNGDTLTVKRQHVTLGGMKSRDMIIVKSGLNSGDRIVTAGAKRLVEGEKVKILTKNNI
jgi:RND family efflux transporter MFP subunit